MYKLKKKHWIQIILIIFIILIGIVFIYYFNLEKMASNIYGPPGCNQSKEYGGCFSTTVVDNLSVKPFYHFCLKVDIDGANCLGYSVNIKNNCDVDFVIGSAIIKPGQYKYLDISGNEGNYELVEWEKSFLPTKDSSYEFKGKLGNSPVTIKFDKSKPFCN